MKKNFRIAALALAVCGLMAACNNNPKEEIVDTIPVIDTTVVEELIDTMPVVDTPAVVTPAPAKKASAKKSQSALKKVADDVKTVKAVTLDTKKDVEQIKGDLKEVKDASSATAKSLPGQKPKAADAFKKN